MKLIAVGVTAAAVAGLAVVEGVPPVEQFWPTTFVGWMSAPLAVAALVTSGYALHKFSQKGVITALAELRTHFDQELQTVRDHYDDEIREMTRMTELQMNQLSVALKERMDGFGRRVGETEEQLTAQGIILSGLAANMAESREDRRHMNGAIASFAAQLQADRESRSNFERQMFTMVSDLSRKLS